MKTRALMIVFLLIALQAATPTQAQAQSGSGGHVGGGGDCDRQAKKMRNILRLWIKNNGGNGMTFRYGIDYMIYQKLMLDILTPGRVEISCVAATPENHYKPIVVAGVQKTCANYPEDEVNPKPRIVCDLDRFLSKTTSSDISRLVDIHHEFASLQKIERSHGSESDNFVSDQVQGLAGEILAPLYAVQPNSNKRATNQLTRINYDLPSTQYTLAGIQAVGGGLLIHWGTVLKDAQVQAHMMNYKRTQRELISSQQNLKSWKSEITESQARIQYQKKLELRNTMMNDSYAINKGPIDDLDQQLNTIEKRIAEGSYPSQQTIDRQVYKWRNKIDVAQEQLIKEKIAMGNAKAAALKRMHWSSKLFKTIKVVGGVLLLVDVGSRTYLWYSTEQTPTFIATADLIRWIKAD